MEALALELGHKLTFQEMFSVLARYLPQFIPASWLGLYRFPQPLTFGDEGRPSLYEASVDAARSASGKIATSQMALPRDLSAAHPVRLSREQLVLDQQILSSTRFQGRAPDTPGGTLAATFVASRFKDIGLESYGGQYEQPFQFTHRSVRALWRRDRPFTKVFTEPRNLVGYVRGTARPDPVIVVSAHFDHLGVIRGEVYPGADDNASGTAALLSMAAWVHAHPLSATVVFAAFDAEELGLRGSQAFVQSLPFPKGQLRLDINLDMLSRSDAGRLFVSGVRYHPDLLTPVVEAAARSSAVELHAGHDRPMLLTGLVDDWTSLSDHGSFHDAGVPFLYFGVEDHDDVHEPSDTADRADAAFFAGAAETALSALVEADARLAR